MPTYLSDVKAVVVNLFHREPGFLVAPKSPIQIKSFEDLNKRGTKFVNRQKGSGTRVLTDHHLKRFQERLFISTRARKEGDT
jgi:putative molybdopterin biosynthesis protein